MKYKNRYQKNPNGNPRGKKYNNWTEEFNRGLQQQTWLSRKKYQWAKISAEDRSIEIMQSEEQREKRMRSNKNFKKAYGTPLRKTKVPLESQKEKRRRWSRNLT